ncbi:uncharacterized protein LOC119079680 [Bradysia coprophila]|uniref:uncharacterized protein LOC119079680 n=1 Tax=Bradysia coprophila TaxID=38358 RepID=UPI00187DD7DD|nr:uncharacterized protein LOC119079680 [Bradysia coprophila]
MRSIVLFLAIASFSQLTLAQREIEGFDVLGPVPSLGRSTAQLYYYLSTNLVTWSEAFQSCVDQGGQLATPLNPLLDEALRQYMVTAGDVAWVGGKAVGSTWRWQTTNQAFTYQMFPANTPNCNVASSCLHVGHNTSTLAWFWCGFNCTQARKFVCEF